MQNQFIGPFRILAPLGAGGMGEVWRAEDTRLGRVVALKLLPADFAEDPERHARFEREARVLASLNHPNIATLYGLENLDGQHVLVMELVNGEGLDWRIARGPIPVADAVPIALQVAEALETAHDAGVVHRDLKPANIMVREDGTVKVLDFGLAKAWETNAGTSDVSLSPTITRHATVEGVILGTAAHMSPEQARGKRVDRRADIWAFGVVLWEMLSGQKLFDGETVTDVLAAVLTQGTDTSGLPATTPVAVRRLLERCLDRDPRTRLRDIGDSGGPNYSVCLRETDGSPMVRLGEGSPVAVSPDDRWVAAIVRSSPARLMVYPTGTDRVVLRRSGMAEVVRALDIRLGCEDPPSLAEIVDSLPMTLDRRVRRGLGEEAGRRFQSASDLEPALQTTADESSFIRTQKPVARRRRRWKALAASEDAP